MALVGRFTKNPSEEYDIDIDYTSKLPTGAALSTIAMNAIDLSDNSDVTATVLNSATGTVSGDKAVIGVQAGTDLADYKITFTSTLDTADIIEDEIIMRVRET